MNTFGTTRQDVGGSSKDRPPRRRMWTLVPFGPCHIPRQMVEFPVLRLAPTLEMFDRCLDGRGDGYQNPNPGITPGLMLVDPAGIPVTTGTNGPAAPNASQRIWNGRIRQGGTDATTLIFSALYDGPAVITNIIFGSSQTSSGILLSSMQFGMAPSVGTPQFKQPSATVALPGIPFFDVSTFTDNEDTPPGMAASTDAGNPANATAPVSIPCRIDVPWSQFALWAILRTVTPTATSLTWDITFETPMGGAVQGSQARGINQFNLGTYLGSGG